MKWSACLCSAVILALACAAGDEPSPPQKLDIEGLHNVFRLNEKLYSGNGPEGDKSFAALQRLGIKTVISVDGAQPDLERAKKHGLRYVHIPIGYNGVPRDKALQLVKAVRELPGPFYIHCHHGKHRGPSAAAVAQLCSDEKCTTASALNYLQRAGTDPRYTGLYKSVGEWLPPTAEELRAAPMPPEAVKVAGMVQAMVTIDHSWDNLKLMRAAGWKTPPDHPDIDPAHEALQLLEGYRELQRLPEIKQRPADFHQWLTQGLADAQELEKLLRAAKDPKNLDAPALERTYRRAAAACTQCHAKYRDVP